MSVSLNSSQVASLKSAVEQKIGFELKTYNSFIALMVAIEKKQSDHMSESTLERIWGYSTRGAKSVSIRSLDVLARFIGMKSWMYYCHSLKSTSVFESEEIEGEGINSSSLTDGDKLQLSWLPNRTITIKYLGNNRFEIINSENSSLKPGDKFECLTFQTGRELYLDHFERKDADMESRYVVGKKSGLTSVSKIGNDAILG